MKLLFLFLLTLCPPVLFAELTDAETLAFLQKQTPEIYQQIAPLEKSDVTDFRSAMDDAKKAASDHAALIALGDTSTAAAYVKMYALDFQAIVLADKIVLATDEKEQQQLMVKMKAVIAASAVQWTIVEQARINRLETELASLKADFQKAITDPSKVIDQDAATLIEECRNYQKRKLRKQR